MSAIGDTSVGIADMVIGSRSDLKLLHKIYDYCKVPFYTFVYIVLLYMTIYIYRMGMRYADAINSYKVINLTYCRCMIISVMLFAIINIIIHYTWDFTDEFELLNKE